MDEVEVVVAHSERATRRETRRTCRDMVNGFLLALPGIHTLVFDHHRTGIGWLAGCRRDGRVSWVPLPEPGVVASALVS